MANAEIDDSDLDEGKDGNGIVEVGKQGGIQVPMS